jgi:hypothetical protein
VEVARLKFPPEKRARWHLPLVPTPLEEPDEENWLLYGEQWTVRIREVRRIQYLNASLVVAIEWRHRAGAISCHRGVRICKPNS